MKGFKKDGKFRPTGNKSKSNLKKSDIRKKKTFHTCPDCEKAEAEQIARANEMKKNKLTLDPEDVISDEEAKELSKDYYNGKGVSQENDKKISDWRKSKASDLYKLYVNKFPNSQIAEEYQRGSLGHGHFGEKLFDGDYASAMYRADGDNLELLKQIGIEHFLSKTTDHPDDESEYDTFMSRYNWAKGRTQEQKEHPLGKPSVN